MRKAKVSFGSVFKGVFYFAASFAMTIIALHVIMWLCDFIVQTFLR